MGSYREGHDIWWTLFHYPRWLLRRTFWFKYRGFGFNEYLWHDSAGKYLWRLVCPIIGHGPLVNVDSDMPSEPPRWHCFRCERDKP